jgi:hypothetical protein
VQQNSKNGEHAEEKSMKRHAGWTGLSGIT